MPVRQLDHIGIAVASHQDASPVYESLLGLQRNHVEEVTSQRVRTAFYACSDVDLELLESTDPDGPIGVFLARQGPGIHHLAFRVDDIDEELARLEAAGVRLIDRTARAGAHGSRIAFVHPKATHGVLVELVERPEA